MKQSLLLLFVFWSSLCYSDITIVHAPNEDYFVEKQIGRGAFGVVYAVHDSEGNEFALKKHIPYGYSGITLNFYEDAQREFSIGQLLDHPNIIKSFDWFTDDDDNDYVLLELVKGKRIHSIQRKSITGEQAITLALQLIDALEYALEAGYIYLDMHSDNMMVTNTFDTKIVDLSSFFSVEELLNLSSNSTSSYSSALNPMRIEKFNRFIAKHQDSFKKVKSLSKSRTLRYFFYLNFDDYVRLIIKIINKSDMERTEKIDLQAEIKKIDWNFEEDYYECTDFPIEEYLDQLRDVLLQ